MGHVQPARIQGGVVLYLEKTKEQFSTWTQLGLNDVLTYQMSLANTVAVEQLFEEANVKKRCHTSNNHLETAN